MVGSRSSNKFVDEIGFEMEIATIFGSSGEIKAIFKNRKDLFDLRRPPCEKEYA